MENTSAPISLLQIQSVRLKMTDERIFKFFLVVATYSIFIYLNCVMFVAVRSKTAFRETSRYILFAHILFNDILHLVTSMVLYIFNALYLEIIQAFCSLLALISTSTFTNEPLNLAVMSLERYIAVCFPLRHGELSTPERTFLALVVIWVLGTANMLTDILTVVFVEPSFFLHSGLCIREQLMKKSWQRNKEVAFSVLFFTLVAGVLLYTYVSITLEARSVSTDRSSAQKAMRTVLLHAAQLCLSLMTFLYTIFEVLMMSLPLDVFAQLRFVNYMVVLLLPRCLSPLIYGLRDQSFQLVFMYYFTYGTRSVKPAKPSSVGAM
ncbi:odorant receptor 131-2-like [Scleropages formosus]|uniref:Odorant receptor 131-2-like n=1 Tax=Scleropages formosus TaxID=113540 RepID=A0A8C9T193_SCLFO|nr:odorant receptor 131-2-like [Scleropages formosus]